MKNLRSVEANVMGLDIVVSEFKPQYNSITML